MKHLKLGAFKPYKIRQMLRQPVKCHFCGHQAVGKVEIIDSPFRGDGGVTRPVCNVHKTSLPTP